MPRFAESSAQQILRSDIGAATQISQASEQGMAKCFSYFVAPQGWERVRRKSSVFIIVLFVPGK